jgi:leucyl-tRNA synthetase
VQVNGKVRGELETGKDCSKEEVLAAAREIEKVSSFLEGKTVRKEIFVPGKIVNFVAG